jgi:hypothetical protein
MRPRAGRRVRSAARVGRSGSGPREWTSGDPSELTATESDAALLRYALATTPSESAYSDHAEAHTRFRFSRNAARVDLRRIHATERTQISDLACGPRMFWTRPACRRRTTAPHLERRQTENFSSHTPPPSVWPSASATSSYGKGRRGALAPSRPCPRASRASPGPGSPPRPLGLDRTTRKVAGRHWRAASAASRSTSRRRSSV